MTFSAQQACVASLLLILIVLHLLLVSVRYHDQIPFFAIENKQAKSFYTFVYAVVMMCYVIRSFFYFTSVAVNVLVLAGSVTSVQCYFWPETFENNFLWIFLCWYLLMFILDCVERCCKRFDKMFVTKLSYDFSKNFLAFIGRVKKKTLFLRF